MTENVSEATAVMCERMAGELEAAARHARVAAGHFGEQSVPHGCAHAFAAQGHSGNARELLDRLAALHASRSRAE